MGKSTISMAIFNSNLYVYRRVMFLLNMDHFPNEFPPILASCAALSSRSTWGPSIHVLETIEIQHLWLLVGG